MTTSCPDSVDSSEPNECFDTLNWRIAATRASSFVKNFGWPIFIIGSRQSRLLCSSTCPRPLLQVLWFDGVGGKRRLKAALGELTSIEHRHKIRIALGHRAPVGWSLADALQIIEDVRIGP